MIDYDLLGELETRTISHGSHRRFGDGTCALELVDYLDRRRHGKAVAKSHKLTDHPACTCPIIATFVRSWNDTLGDGEKGDADRKRLLGPLVPLMLDTAGSPALETARAWLIVDWLARFFAPEWLELAGLKEEAEELRSLPEITAATAGAALEIQERARKKAHAAWAAASAAASAAAWAAAWAAASAAARDAAWAAARDAARDAAWAALSPTVARLQVSAQDLVRRLCAMEVA